MGLRLTPAQFRAIAAPAAPPSRPRLPTPPKMPPVFVSSYTVLRGSSCSYVVTVENWRPASDNVQRRGHWAWRKARAADDAIVAALVAGGRSGVPRAAGKRRLAVVVEMPGRRVDGSNLNKSLRDSLVNCYLLIGDDAGGVEGSDPVVVPGPVLRTILTLEDL
jgi:hypothetical protein